MKRLISLMLILIMACVPMISGCSLNPSHDPSTVIAKIGTRSVTLGEYEQTFDMYANMYYSYYSQDVCSDLETLTNFQETIFDMLVGTMCALHMGDELNLFDYTEEQKTELQTLIDDELTSLVEYHTNAAEQAGATDIAARVEELIIEEGQYFLGEDCTRESYEAYLTNMITENYQIELVKEAVLVDVTVEESSVMEQYNTVVASDKETYDEDPGAYKDDQEYYDAYADQSYRPYYVPEGYSRVMHIFTSAEGKIDEEYTELEKRCAEITEEYGKLAIEDASNGTEENADTMATLLSEYNEAQEKMTTLYEAHYAEAKAKINEAYAKLVAGTAFSEVLAEYTEDADFVETEYFMKNGMLISRYESYTDWSDLIKEEFLKLSIGEYSQVFSDSTGYHILYYVGDVPEGNISFDDVKDELTASLLENAKDDEWEELIEEWRKSEELVADIEDVRHVGADNLPAA